MPSELDKTVEDVWQRVILFSLSMGGILVSFVVVRDVLEGHHADAIINVTFFSVFLFLLLSKRVPFRFRRILVILLVFGLAAREYLLHALNPDSAFFLMTGVALVALTMGPRVGFYVIAVVLVVIPAASYLRSSGALVEMGINASREDELRLLIAYMIEAALYCSVINYLVGTLAHRVVSESAERIQSLLRERESEEKLLLVEQNHMLGLAIMQPGQSVHMNEAALKMQEFTSDDAESWSHVADGIRARCHPDDRDALERHIADWEQSEVDNHIAGLNYRAVMPDGRIKWIDQHAKTIRLNGEPTTLIMMMDNTERMEALAENQRLEEQISQAQKMDAIGRLAGGVAHDLNNLLTPILGYADLILQEESLNRETRDGVEQVVYAASSARELVHQLLTFSRKQETRMEPIDVNTMINDFRNLAQFTLRENVSFEFIPGDGLPKILGDRNKIEQIIMNLLVNGQQAMPDGGTITLSTVSTHVSASDVSRFPDLDQGSYVVIRIEDTGEGIKEEHQSKIFDPFFTTKGMEGTGLGLAIAYGIVQQHGGRIELESRPGEGAVFSIMLPALDPESVEMARVVVKETSGQATAKRAKTVLLAEDNQQVLELANLMLSGMGHKVLAAQNGKEAVDTAKTFGGEIDLLLTDVIMPDLNGPATFEAIRKVYPDIKVIFMSGFTDGAVVEYKDVENAAFVQKPFTAQTLQSAVEQVFSEQLST